MRKVAAPVPARASRRLRATRPTRSSSPRPSPTSRRSSTTSWTDLFLIAKADGAVHEAESHLSSPRRAGVRTRRRLVREHARASRPPSRRPLCRDRSLAGLEPRPAQVPPSPARARQPSRSRASPGACPPRRSGSPPTAWPPSTPAWDQIAASSRGSEAVMGRSSTGRAVRRRQPCRRARSSPRPTTGKRRDGRLPRHAGPALYGHELTPDEALARLVRSDGPRSRAHYMAYEDGRIFQLVPEARRAWHAGAGTWAGDSDINSCSIGIEIAHPGHQGGLPPYPDAQIEAVIRLAGDIIERCRDRAGACARPFRRGAVAKRGSG